MESWILRLRPWNFAIVSESSAPHLEKVWQTVPKFWSICITYKSTVKYEI